MFKNFVILISVILNAALLSFVYDVRCLISFNGSVDFCRFTEIILSIV